MSDRNEFEAWAKDRKFIIRLDEVTNDSRGRRIYSNVMTQGAWMAWEAATEKGGIERDAAIVLLFACEEAIDSVQSRPKPEDQEVAAMREQIIKDVMAVHSRLQVAFCGVPSLCDGYLARN